MRLKWPIRDNIFIDTSVPGHMVAAAPRLFKIVVNKEGYIVA